jgi:hypothetical protein
MGNIFEAIDGDINEYIRLCDKYKEKPKTDEHGINPYCDHAHELQKRQQEEWKKEYKKNNPG